jgi:hypothetical protein
MGVLTRQTSDPPMDGFAVANIRHQTSEVRGQRSEEARIFAYRVLLRKKARVTPFKERFFKYNENISFDRVRWSDFYRDCAS